MGYLHIDNLYKNPLISLFRECFALEKIHGTSAHLKFSMMMGQDGVVPHVTFSAGGAKHDTFVAMFDEQKLKDAFVQTGHMELTIYGEAYGGKMQGMKDTYGANLKFVAFDVEIGDHWLNVPDAADVVSKFGLEFVHFWKTSTDTDALNALRDADSVQAIRNGCGPGKKMEGVVLRPLVEMRLNSGARVIAKHKRPEFSERTSKKDTTVDAGQLQVLADAEAIAREWVTTMRLTHVVDKLQAELGREPDLSNMRDVIDRMVEDIRREGAGEFKESKEAVKAICNTTAKLFKQRVTAI